MTSRFFPARNDYPEKGGYKVLRPVRPDKPKMSVRSALLVLLALYAALVDAALLYAARQAAPLILVTAAGAFVGAFHFFDGLIED
jgi:hypothetical protein